ncbi:MFS transporter [Verticiella sediminum]|uniref:MFS transporter n=1 Tax=Verticiella sediminum TaxID=1247510 RepID=A0A556AYR6_9BURK|nr:MFS transporter [Verticiella sediminum]TSH98079.1 MFS transporter [Verticiella sediminum]
MKTTFYGWRIVTACMLLATVSWSLGVFGMGVYVYALTNHQGFSISTVSTAVTSAYVVSALLMVSVGRLIARRGPRVVVAAGVLAMALGVMAMPHCRQPWHLYAAFAMLGVGMAALSTNTIGSTLAPWFERHQGRAMSTAMLGASIGGMIGTPLLMGGMRIWSFQTTAALAAAVAILVVLPLAALVIKTRPQDIGQFPDGAAAPPDTHASQAVPWRLGSALATRQFRSHVVAFGLGLMVQIGFLSHHVPIAIPVLGAGGAAVAVSAAAIAAFVGRLLLARYADRIDVRKAGAGVLLLAAAALVGMALFPSPWALMALSIVYGLTVGNVTTLAPMIIRREFGAASFGAVFGLAATLNQLAMSLGPSLFGGLRDAFGSYGPGLLLCSVLNVAAAAVIVWGGRLPLTAQEPRYVE